ncbi:MAG: cation diffusion facilitator family transporter [Candidatus Saccharibacteria bacterium]|nr:cation diffusion facilitator family transporter [Candidatus Saccharibacteria bacterium]
MEKQESFEKTAVRVSYVSIISNAVLTVLKLFAGIFAKSSAMISDAIHSASDVLSSIVVIVGVKIASKESDKNHPYGHERYESVAAIVLSAMLGATGLTLGYNAVLNLIRGDYVGSEIPGILAAVAAVISIIVKEAMYWYTRYYAKKIDSNALMADAWHHRSDSLSSIGSLIGVMGARMGLAWFDPAASIVICLFILKAAYEIFFDAVNQMVDHSCSEDVEKAIVKCAKKHPRMLGIERLRTREFGNKIYVDLRIYADDTISFVESDQIAKEIHDMVEQEFPKIKHINVMMRPKTVKKK